MTYTTGERTPAKAGEVAEVRKHARPEARASTNAADIAPNCSTGVKPNMEECSDREGRSRSPCAPSLKDQFEFYRWLGRIAPAKLLVLVEAPQRTLAVIGFFPSELALRNTKREPQNRPVLVN